MIKTPDHRDHSCRNAIQKKRSKRVSAGARPFAFEHSDLLPQREDFKRCIHATAEEHADGGEECGDEIEHESTPCNTL